MFAPVTGLPKYCAKATTLTCAAASSSEERVTVPIPAGSTVMIDIPGLHYNGGSRLCQRTIIFTLQDRKILEESFRMDSGSILD